MSKDIEDNIKEFNHCDRILSEEILAQLDQAIENYKQGKCVQVIDLEHLNNLLKEDMTEIEEFLTEE